MLQRGRKSLASLTVADPGSLSRIPPPVGLTEAELTVWLATVNSKPSEWFRTEHIPILKNYCRHVVNADLMDAELKAFEPEWLKDDAGLKRYQKLMSIFRQETKVAQEFAKSMRLTQQAQYRADKAATLSSKVQTRQPWQKENTAVDSETSSGLRNTA